MANSIKWNDPAFATLSKLPGVQAELYKVAQSMAAGANSEAQSYMNELGIDEFEKPPFAARTNIIRYTAVATATTNSEMGRKIQAKHQSLNHQNH